MNKKLFIPALALVVLIGGSTLATTKASAMSLSGFLGIGNGDSSAHVTADANGNDNMNGQRDFRGAPNMGGHGVFGTVTAISGSTITIQSKAWSNPSTGSTSATTTYTVNAGSATVMKAGATSSLSAITVGDTIVVQGTVSGTTVTATKINDGVVPGMGMGQGGRGVFGTVTAINGDSITVQSKAMGNNAAATYTVDATNATVTKAGSASSVSNIAVGDTIVVQGTVSGTSVTATKINDGVMARTPGSNGGATMPQGNGQPIIGGKVTAVSGDTITISNSSNTSYTIDVTNAKIMKGDAASSVSNIAVGDEVVAQGTINGTSVTAVSLTDTTSTSTGAHKGILGSIGSFFSHLFGF